MYQTGDRVVYGIHGVCDITDMERQMVDRKPVTYLVLEPLGQPGARYLVPTHKEAALAKLKEILTKEQLETMLSAEETRQDHWIREEGQRKQSYREVIGSGDRQRLMAMVHTLYRHRTEQMAAGKKIHLCDENFLRDAEKLLAGEAAVILGLSQEDAKQYIRSRLK